MERKFNRRFNARRKRIERWHKIVIMLSGFEGVVNDYDGENPDGVKALRDIHRKLYECSVTAKEHLNKAENFSGFLRKEERR